MGVATEIAWTDHTFNPWMGCTKVSPGCDNCYAEALGKRTGRVQWGDDSPRVPTGDGYWRNPLKWDRAAAVAGRNARVFCASMADVFEDRPELVQIRSRLFALIDDTPHLDWQLLTKRPRNVMELVPDEWVIGGFPTNVWVGTTAEDQDRADERVPQLLNIPARVRFLSCEPLIGAVHLRAGWISPTFPRLTVDWVIAGGESGPHHRPLDLDWARSLRDQCHRAGVPFFFKQVGGRTPKAGGDLLDGVRSHQFPRSHG